MQELKDREERCDMLFSGCGTAVWPQTHSSCGHLSAQDLTSMGGGGARRSPPVPQSLLAVASWWEVCIVDMNKAMSRTPRPWTQGESAKPFPWARLGSGKTISPSRSVYE